MKHDVKAVACAGQFGSVQISAYLSVCGALIVLFES